MKLFSKFLIVYIIIFSLYMIYFYFKNKSKKRKYNLTKEMNYLIMIYGIDINLIGLSKIEKHIALINSFIITLDLFIYFLMKLLILKMLIIFIVTFILIFVFYSFLAKYYIKILRR